MYPESLLWWLGGTAVLVGILGLIGLLAWRVDVWHQRHADRHRKNRDEGRLLMRDSFVMFLVILAAIIAAGLLFMVVD